MADVPVNPSTAFSVVDVVENGQTAFDFDFRADAIEDLRAIYRQDGIAAIELVGGTDFSADGLGSASGGSISLLTFSETVAGAQLAIYRETEIKRLADYQRDLFAATLNQEFDVVFMILQEIRTQLLLSVKVAPGETPPDANEFLQAIEDAEEAAATSLSSATLAVAAASTAVSQSNVPVIATEELIPSLAIPAGLAALIVEGQAELGDGGDGILIEVASDPAPIPSVVDSLGRRFARSELVVPRGDREWKLDWFGAIDHLTTDQVEVFQKAYDAYDPDQGGVKIILPAKRMVVNAGATNTPVYLDKPRLTIEGVPGTELLKTVANRQMFVIGSSFQGEGERVEDIVLRDITIKGYGIADTSDDYPTIMARYVKRARIERIKTFDLSHSIRVGRGELTWPLASQYAENCKILDCEITNPIFFAIEVHGGRRVDVVGNTILGGEDAHPEDNIAIRIVKGLDVVVDLNRIEDTGYGVGFSTTSGDDQRNIQILRNTIRGTFYASSIQGGGPIQGLYIKGNKIWTGAGGQYGINYGWADTASTPSECIDIEVDENFIEVLGANILGMIRLDGAGKSRVRKNVLRYLGIPQAGVTHYGIRLVGCNRDADVSENDIEMDQTTAVPIQNSSNLEFGYDTLRPTARNNIIKARLGVAGVVKGSGGVDWLKGAGTWNADGTASGTPVDTNSYITITDLDYSAWSLFRAMPTMPSFKYQKAYSDLIGALRTAGVWNKIDRLFIFAGHDPEAVIYDVRNPARTIAPVGFSISDPAIKTYDDSNADAIFRVGKGFKGDGSIYLDPNFIPLTAGGVMTQNSAHVGLYIQSGSGEDKYDFGASTALGDTLIQTRRADGTMASRLNDDTNNTVAVTSPVGHSLISRTASTGYARYKNGSALSAVTSASTALPGSPLLVMGISGSYSTKRFAAAHWGSGLTSGEATAFYNALQAYMVAVGAA